MAIDAKVRQLKKEGRSIIDFGAGQLDFNTPDNIKQAAKEAINNNFSRYTPSGGIPELRDAAAKKFGRDNKINYDASEVIISCGAKHALYNASMALLNEGDEVILPSPYWASYSEMINMAQAKAVICKTDEMFRIAIEDIKDKITGKTRMLVLNSPNNPTGKVLESAELGKIAELAVKNNFYVVSDEVYEFFIYGAREHLSIASLNDEIKKLTLTVNSVSKTYAMTGWRVGFCGAEKKIINIMEDMQSHSSNPSSIAQMAALEALNGPQDGVFRMVDALNERRKFMYKRLNEINGISCLEPQGAFYVFVDIKESKMSSMDFASKLLSDFLVAVVPGIAFGSDNHVRLSYACSLEDIEKGMDRVEKFVEGNNKK